MQPGRRFIWVVSAAAVGLVVVGFGIAALDPPFGRGTPSAADSRSPLALASEQPSLTASPAVSATPTRSTGPSPSAPPTSPTPSASATHAPGFVAGDDGVAYFAADGSRIPVVAVPGLTVQVQNGRAVYYANSGNKFGLKTGSYAGEFVPLVTMGQLDGSSSQTGGVVLAGSVVTKLTNDGLAKIADAPSRWIIALPVDIRGARAGNVDVSFDAFGLSGIANTPRVVIRFPGTVPLVESVPSNGGVHALVEGINVTRWQVIDPVRLKLSRTKLDPGKPMNELLIYGGGATSLDFDQFIDGRIAVGAHIMDITGDLSVSLAVDGSHADIEPQDVLQVGGVPVFVASSS